MSGQEQQRPQRREDEPDDAPAAPPPGAAAAKQASNDDIDAVLDEIDEVLESNAEDFVRAFVQKGGE
jgi:ubiquitin-like protein Pup